MEKKRYAAKTDVRGELRIESAPIRYEIPAGEITQEVHPEVLKRLLAAGTVAEIEPDAEKRPDKKER